MYCTPPETRTARKPRRCMNCGEVIEIGTKFQRWMSIDDGKSQTNTMHPECLDALNDEYGSGYWEYTLYSGERPGSRMSNTDAPNAPVTGRPPAEGGECDELGERDGR